MNLPPPRKNTGLDAKVRRWRGSTSYTLRSVSKGDKRLSPLHQHISRQCGEGLTENLQVTANKFILTPESNQPVYRQGKRRIIIKNSPYM